MNLYRSIEIELKHWKERDDHKPLVIEGARQVGKTWAMQNFGKKYYKHTAYFNFENSSELCREFKSTKSPDRIISILQLYCGFKITPEDTLIIFDEIQECEDALISLKYFCEEAPQYHIISAGSLLGVSVARSGSFPVGKVDFLRMYPLTFKEMLYSLDSQVYEYLNGLAEFEQLPELIYNKLNNYYRQYLICGGMPQAVIKMLETNDISIVDNTLRDILRSYTLDFSKHAPKSDIPKIGEIWKSIPSQLAKENRKFVYKLVRPGARAREYENALVWLQQAGLIYRVNCISKPAIPLPAYDDVSAFKIYLFDIGILRILSGLEASVFIEDNPLFSEFKGAYFENAVLQSLTAQYEVNPRYWVSNSGKAEVDFIIQSGSEIIPIEVKASHNTSGQSLAQYIKNFSPRRALVVASSNITKKQTDTTEIIHLPHPITDWLKNLS